ncbi:TetR/AcrR family transcriptional regulator [Raineyella fluvialis]|uniref:TetR family transcriptional regulator n=1 Tax=Raineyella fluvialis TaxID=2662261 RepID=A0A5Q2FDI6_9ACTN|nr:TetR family transcriptional regulator [Raineyella fluvialis]QGF23163.1 TetR family transcriptional regulator [Raineyella fluvialis]
MTPDNDRTTRTDRVPRQRLDADTRRGEILAAADGLFAAAPYADVSVVAVATAAGASEALVFRYFGTKAALYAEVVRASLAELARQQAAAVAALPPNTSARDRVTTSLGIALDHVADGTPGARGFLEGGTEPPQALAVRREARLATVEALRQMLVPSPWDRHEYALWGFLGFLDGACAHWIAGGCREEERWPLIEAALGALQGALGDWGR